LFGHANTVEVLLDNPNVCVNQMGSNRVTPLHVACGNNHEKLASFLTLKDDVNLSLEDYLGNKPLCSAWKKKEIWNAWENYKNDYQSRDRRYSHNL